MIDKFTGLGSVGPVKPSKDVQRAEKAQQAGDEDFKAILDKVNKAIDKIDEFTKDIESRSIKTLEQLDQKIVDSKPLNDSIRDIKKIISAYDLNKEGTDKGDLHG